MGHGRFRVEFAIGVRKGNNLSAPGRPSGKKINIHGGSATSQAGKRLVYDDAGKPSAQSGFTTESVEIAEGADVGLLQHVFGVAIISYDAACDTVEPSVLPLDNQPDRRAVVLAGAFNELGLVWRGFWMSMFSHLDIQ